MGFVTVAVIQLALFLVFSINCRNTTGVEQHEHHVLDTALFLTKVDTQCISYRYVSCRINMKTLNLIYQDEEMDDPNLSESNFQCVSYRFIPCREVSPNLIFKVVNEQERLGQTRATYSKRLKKCEEDKHFDLSVLATESYCLTSRLTECEISQLISMENMKMCNEKEQILTQQLNVTENEKFVLQTEKLTLTDRVNKSETSRKKSDENLEVCKELVHNVTLQLADCKMENMGTKEFDKSTSCQNETPALLSTALRALQSKSHCETKLTNCLEKKDADPTLKMFDDLFKERRVLASYIAPFLINTPYPGVEKYTSYASVLLGLFPLKNVKALMPEFGPVINDVTSFQYPITISSCGNSQKPDVFIAVISAPDNFKRRTKIRQSWKNQINLVLKKGLLGRIHFAFVLGRAETNLTQQRIEEENTSNNDIIQIEMLDFYRNLPLKMAGQLNWVRNNCPQIDFVLKVDDDMYVNLYVLAHFVKSYNESGKMTIFGQSVRYSGYNNWGPARNADDQQEIKIDAWPWNTYPNYVNAPAYLMHGSSILPLLAAIQTTPFIPFEDVYLNGICAEKAGIKTQFSSNMFGLDSLGISIITALFKPRQCQLDHYLTWKMGESGLEGHSRYFNLINDFYRGSSYCKPKESVKFGFVNDKSNF